MLTYRTCRPGGVAAAVGLGALGVGLALAVGSGTAQADSPGSASDTSSTQQHRGPGVKANSVAAARRAVPTRSALAAKPSSTSISDGPSIVPALTSRGGTTAARARPKLVDRFSYSAPPVPEAGPNAAPVDEVAPLTDSGPDPDAMTPTQYGDIGNWMLQPNGEIADWIGNQYEGKTLLEGINVIIIDPNADTLRRAAQRLNRAMIMSGFPGVIFHSTGYQGIINDITYSQQQPMGVSMGYSDAFFLLPNNHGRIFGPFPREEGGYMWIAALSREQLGTYEGTLTHVFVSFNEARDALRDALVLHTGATDLGQVDLDNTYNEGDYTTGDADGFAAVIELT